MDRWKVVQKHLCTNIRQTLFLPTIRFEGIHSGCAAVITVAIVFLHCTLNRHFSWCGMNTFYMTFVVDFFPHLVQSSLKWSSFFFWLMIWFKKLAPISLLDISISQLQIIFSVLFLFSFHKLQISFFVLFLFSFHKHKYCLINVVVEYSLKKIINLFITSYFFERNDGLGAIVMKTRTMLNSCFIFSITFSSKEWSFRKIQIIL